MHLTRLIAGTNCGFCPAILVTQRKPSDHVVIVEGSIGFGGAMTEGASCVLDVLGSCGRSIAGGLVFASLAPERSMPGTVEGVKVALGVLYLARVARMDWRSGVVFIVQVESYCLAAGSLFDGDRHAKLSCHLTDARKSSIEKYP